MPRIQCYHRRCGKIGVYVCHFSVRSQLLSNASVFRLICIILLALCSGQSCRLPGASRKANVIKLVSEFQVLNRSMDPKTYLAPLIAQLPPPVQYNLLPQVCVCVPTSIQSENSGSNERSEFARPHLSRPRSASPERSAWFVPFLTSLSPFCSFLQFVWWECSTS